MDVKPDDDEGKGEEEEENPGEEDEPISILDAESRRPEENSLLGRSDTGTYEVSDMMMGMFFAKFSTSKLEVIGRQVVQDQVGCCAVHP